MKNFSDNIWKTTKNWKFDPIMFLICLLTIRNSLLTLPINLCIVMFYCKSSNKYTNVYFKKFIIRYILLGILFLFVIFVLLFWVSFWVYFDMSEKDRNFVLDTGVFIVLSCIKIIFAVLMSYFSQKYKKKSYKKELTE